MGQAKSDSTVGAAGFTLLELIVALSVSAMVVLGLQAAVSVTADVASRGSDRATDALRLEAAHAAIRGWFQGAYGPADLEGVHFDGRDSTRLGRPMDQVTFVTLDPGPITQGSETPLRIRLRVDDRDRRGLVAEYAHLGAGGRPRKLTMLPEVGGMNVRYLVSVFDELRWFDGWSSEFQTPLAVEIQFYAARGDTLPHMLEPPLLVTLPRRR